MPSETPTVLLVHGAFANTGSWAPVITELKAAGITAQACVNPLRGLTHDGDYVGSVASQIDGPVVLVGHSYGGPVITHAGTKADNVKALVYVASFGLDQGETSLGSVADFPDPELATALVPHAYPLEGGETGTEFTLDEAKFASVFAADLPAEQTAILAISQNPAADIAFGEPLGVEPAWKTTPSWFIVATADNAINPDSQRAAAKKLGSTTSEIEGGSHAIAVSNAATVAGVIKDAVASL